MVKQHVSSASDYVNRNPWTATHHLTMSQKDGLCLCNSPQKKSAIAYYANFSYDDGSNGQQPGAPVYLSNGTDFIWEGNQQGECHVTFHLPRRVSSQIRGGEIHSGTDS